jgi:hypothetical protein
MPGLPPGIVPIFPSTKTFKLGKSGDTIRHLQFSLTPAYAFTNYKVQGQTMEIIIVDLSKPPTGSISRFNAYIALLHGRGRENIQLLQPFNHKLFTIHPNEKLCQEDARLLLLEKDTLEHYNTSKFTLM